MVLKLIFAPDENPKDVNELQISAAIEDVCRQLPDVDIDAVGYLLQAQAAIDRLKNESKLNERCKACTEEK